MELYTLLPCALTSHSNQIAQRSNAQRSAPKKRKARKLSPGAERNFLPTQYITAVKFAGVSRSQPHDRRAIRRLPHLVTIRLFAAYTSHVQALKARAASTRAAQWNRADDARSE
jgi:hypothetical protein